MKRIAIFSITFHPFVGGAEIAIKEITDRIAGYEFVLYTAKLDEALPDMERMGNILVHRVGTGKRRLDKWLYPFGAARLALAHHKEKRFDMVWAVMATYAGLAALLFKKRQPHVPYLLTLQSGDPDEFIQKRTWFWKKIYAQIYTKADKIIAISSWLRSRAKRYGYAGEILVVPNGVDVSNFSGALMRKDERAFIRKSWGLVEGDFVVVTASRLVYKNAIDMLMASLSHLPKQVKLVIAGAGGDEEQLKAQAQSFQGRVVFLGEMPHTDLPRVLKACDVFARPSRSEGLGNAFIEARAIGLAVIGTAVGGINDLIEAGIVEACEGTAEGIAEKIKEVMDRPKVRKGNAEIRELIKKQYNWDYIAKQYESEYEKLISKKHVPVN